MDLDDDLIAAFWRLVPERVAMATELWLGYEQAEPNALRELKRLLHTTKGEAHMLQLPLVGQMLEAAERVIARIPQRADADSPAVAAALLESFEALAAELASAERGAGPELVAQAERLNALARSLPEPAPAPAPGAGGEQAAPLAASRALTLDPERVQPIASELRRLLEERSGAALKLREAHRMLRAVLAEIDPSLPPAVLAERAIKTVGYGWEVERRLTEVRALWSDGEFAFEQSIESLEEVVQAASKIQVASMATRMVRLARSTALTLGKEVDFELKGDAAVDSVVARRLEAALVHLVRNAVDHGIEPEEQRLAAGKSARGLIRIDVSGAAGRVEIAIADDGAGVDLERLRARLGIEADGLNEQQLLQTIFRHGLSTRADTNEISGRGVGLDVVLEQVQGVGGTVQVESRTGTGTRFVLRMPTSMRVDVIVPLHVGALRCGVPSHAVVQVTRTTDIVPSAQGPRARVVLDGGAELVRVISLRRLLGEPHEEQGRVLAVVAHRGERIALEIDGYGSPRPMALQDRGELSFHSPLVAAATPTPDGHVLLVLDLGELFAQALSVGGQQVARAAAASVKHIVVAEDAPVARELLCGILRSFGLRVSEAADGRQALALAKRNPPDLLMTDLDMPFMGGVELIAELQRDPQLRNVPVIVLTTRDDAPTRERVLALGVRGFLTKQKFVESQLRALVDACLELA